MVEALNPALAIVAIRLVRLMDRVTAGLSALASQKAIGRYSGRCRIIGPPVMDYDQQRIPAGTGVGHISDPCGRLSSILYCCPGIATRQAGIL